MVNPAVSCIPELLVLASLAGGPKSGYAIMLDIERFSGITLGPRTLSAAITRLVEKRLVAPTSPPSCRRPYRLTVNGVAYLEAQLDIGNYGGQRWTM